ncbi:MAG: cytochrome c [Acidobacteriota bacterium]|nr:cytochrome c [Acidobacteriota bacterium]
MSATSYATAAGAVVLALAVLAGEAPAGAAQNRTVWDGVYTAEQAQRGAPLYEQSCAECHGSDLTGGEMAPGLAGSEFAWNWNGLSVGDLFERVRISMPQGEPSTVSRQDKADILAFMFERSGFPAGETELASRTAMLAGINFVAEAPAPR